MPLQVKGLKFRLNYLVFTGASLISRKKVKIDGVKNYLSYSIESVKLWDYLRKTERVFHLVHKRDINDKPIEFSVGSLEYDNHMFKVVYVIPHEELFIRKDSLKRIRKRLSHAINIYKGQKLARSIIPLPEWMDIYEQEQETDTCSCV